MIISSKTKTSHHSRIASSPKNIKRIETQFMRIGGVRGVGQREKKMGKEKEKGGGSCGQRSQSK